MAAKVINLKRKTKSKKVTKPKTKAKVKRKTKAKVTPMMKTKAIQGIILMGNVGTGKTTLAKELVSENNFVRTSHDDLIQMIKFGTYSRKDRDVYHEIETMAIAAFFKFQRNFVIDRTNMTKMERARWIKLMKDYAYYAPHVTLSIKIVDFGRGTDESLDRVVQREIDKHGCGSVGCMDETKTKWEKIYGIMYNAYEKPTLDEGVGLIQDFNTGEITES